MIYKMSHILGGTQGNTIYRIDLPYKLEKNQW